MKKGLGLWVGESEILEEDEEKMMAVGLQQCSGTTMTVV